MSGDHEIHRTVDLAATPKQVWQAITTRAGLAAWFMPMPDTDPDSDPVTAYEAPKRLAVSLPPGPDGATQSFEYLIEATGGGSTVLRFTHGFAGGDWNDEFFAVTGAGWDMYLHTLAEYLAHFPGRPCAYAEAEGPAATADPAAWPVLLRALGLDGPPRPGQPVRLTPAGLAPVDGVADWVSDAFLGVRTADALHRFHRRAAIGLPIATSHHLYGHTADSAETVGTAWAEWLGRVFGQESAR